MKKTTTANRLRQIMDEKSIKQVDIIRLAEPICHRYKVKMGRNDISQYISGKVEPRQNKIFILAKALDVNEAWLMGYDVPKERELSYSDDILKTYTNKTYTPHEEKVIEKYRSKPEMQPAVDKLLGIEPEDNVTTLEKYNDQPFIAASSGKEYHVKAPDEKTKIKLKKDKYK